MICELVAPLISGPLHADKRIYKQVREVSKDIALSVQHPGQIVPDLEEIKTAGLDEDLQSWLKSAEKLFYTWHCCKCIAVGSWCISCCSLSPS